MPIRWSAVSVAEAMDEIEALINQAEPFLAEAEEKAGQAKGIRNLPEYMGVASVASDSPLRAGRI